MTCSCLISTECESDYFKGKKQILDKIDTNFVYHNTVVHNLASLTHFSASFLFSPSPLFPLRIKEVISMESNFPLSFKIIEFIAPLPHPHEIKNVY